jgi:hypothetical protein
MARGRWEDFKDKYGFNDGDSVDTLDFAARDFLVRRLNQNPVMKAEKLRALAHRFAGVHNGARILILRDKGPTKAKSSARDDLLEVIEPVELPEELENVIGDLVDASYDEAWDALITPRKGIIRPRRKATARKAK